MPSRPHRNDLLFKTEEEDTIQVYCPLIEEKCGLLECGGCPAIGPRVWLCSACVRVYPAEPFWTSGHCADCGDYSSFLAPVKR